MEQLPSSHELSLKTEGSLTIQEDSNPEHDVTSSSKDQEMMNMFASVWVKVEVNDVEESSSNNVFEVEPDIEAYTKPKRNKHKLPSKYKCDKCDYATAHRNCLKIHVLGHDGVKPFSCTTCNYTTKYQTALTRHMLVKHQADDQLVNSKSATIHKCDVCDYTTFYKWNLNNHRQKHKNEKQFKCSECDYATAYRQHFAKHKKRHNKDTRNMMYKCDKCPFMTRFDGHISRHLAKIHNIISEKANRCDYCDFSTKVNWRLTIHKTRSKQEEVLKCGFCGYETYYMCQSKIHKRMHFKELYKNNRKNKVKTPVETDEQTSQVEEVDPDVKLEEILLNKKAQKYTLDPDCVDWKNIDVLESEDKDKPFQCHMCTYTARFKASVQRHFQRRHTGPQNRPYKCVNCDFSTKTRDQIALHNKRSQSKVIVRCNHCPFSTHFKCQFVMHQKSHYEHECPNCEFKCRNKYDMQKHFTIVHLGDGLKCQYCDFQATRKESLLSHETIHTGIKPFKCAVPLCEYTSVRKSLLRNHIRRWHSDVQDNVTIVSEHKIQSLKLPVEDVLQSVANNVHKNI